MDNQGTSVFFISKLCGNECWSGRQALRYNGIVTDNADITEKVSIMTKKANSEVRTIYTPQGALTYELFRKAVKNVNLRIDREGRVKVSANPRVPMSFIDGFVREKERFIREGIENVRKREAERGGGAAGS